MKLNLIRGALFAAMFGLLIGCDKIKNVSCGDATEYITDLESHYLTSIPGNGRTTLIYENTNEDPSDICSLAHLDASFSLSLHLLYQRMLLYRDLSTGLVCWKKK